MSAPRTVVTRFAPSPSGHLHVGGARSALFCWAYARQKGGRFLLRIEDTDQKRSSDSASIGFLADLKWLGIDWDEGPSFEGCGGGPNGPYFQSERLDLYNEQLDRLIQSGNAYFAFETAEELDAKRKLAKGEGRAYRYDRAALSLSREEVQSKLAAGVSGVIRFKCPGQDVTIVDEILGSATIPAGEIDDFVIRKADGFPTYHFAVVVDDEFMQVTHVLRAQEHFTNTAKHMLLQDALGYRRPIYGHMPIICNPDGSKMSKRDKDKLLRTAVKSANLTHPPENTVDPATFQSWMQDKNKQLDLADAQKVAEALRVVLPEINVDDFRRSGYLPEVICNFLALNGWSPGHDIEKFDNAFLIERLQLDRIQKTAAKFDRVKLLSFNADAISAMDREVYITRARAHGECYHAQFLERLAAGAFEKLAAASHERTKTLNEMFVTNDWAVADDESITVDAKTADKVLQRGAPTGLTHLIALVPLLNGVAEANWNPQHLESIIKRYADGAAEGQMGKVAQPLRVALTGGTVSPPIFDTLTVLSKSSVMTRVRRCIHAFTSPA
ncbi:MAG: glutamate--tRNA ligase [Planctomycetota bacterium]|nr:glutamate--tRNA ligase [Planctomycetota bacterium]